MPYAFAHPAAVVPVAKMLGARAVPSALAIGAMIPDAWYIVPLLEREHGHDLPGALLFCVPAGLLAYMAFHLIFKQPLLALAPRWLAERLAAWTTPRLPRAPWHRVLLSLLAGIATHLAWDAFTHAGYFPILETRVAGGIYLHQLLQHTSTLLGTWFLAAWIRRKLRATQPMVLVRVLDDRLRYAVMAAMTGLPATAFLIALRTFEAEPAALALRAAGVTALSAFGLLALFFSVGWRLAR
ncbi:MAG: DUF4184 family protein [Burkholderiales bacterium]